ncbi:SDR family oxidoreductase [Streptosporangium sp. NBC_01756]|uniref:SDR family oxidoreductase n=1 Tax=Streptosporangium sp. NBC_01756 TaxID=2975950 RepID=UPI002DDA7C22|nr:SDR family oxidoreductase [Streptosporangium sp. NBC_01756]WSC83843.1 SDR family oxidoreductase [Streptosporangium sp. NBC_01756]
MTLEGRRVLVMGGSSKIGEARAALFAEHTAMLPVGRVGTAQDVAQAVVLAATNGFITGNVIEVNGGLTRGGQLTG